MSAIHFHSEHGDATVRGTERYYFGNFIGDLFNVALGLDHQTSDPPIRALVMPGHYVNELPRDKFVRSLKTALLVDSDPVFQIEGQPVKTFVAQLNTALAVGNDTVKLMARIHGQCEIHTWVGGKNRAWLAGIIEQGINSGLLREADDWKTGWVNVVELLRSRDDGPVVTSFSDSFPNAGVADWTPPVEDGEPDWDRWYDLTDAEQWRLAFEGLQMQEDSRLELRPEGWSEFYFGDGINAFHILQATRRNQ